MASKISFLRGLIALTFAAALPLDIQGQTNQAKAANDVNEAYLREHYTKFEHMVPMRDGVKLLTTVFAPKDDSEPHPILITRTPYSVKPYSEDRYPNPGGPLK